LVRAVEEYQAMAQAGLPADPQSFAKRNPEIARELTACLEDLELVNQAAAPALNGAGGDIPGESTGEPPPHTLGDFRIIREVGRGGTGVVYEAEQISLGRLVGLKVLPFAATLDPRQLQRFHNEARAASSLHKEHIVPVHAVGQERGVHYYAMQFIEGQALDAVIREPRQLHGRDKDGPKVLLKLNGQLTTAYAEPL
jgi:eukaryotic-like serine/threonine-protein kinase